MRNNPNLRIEWYITKYNTFKIGLIVNQYLVADFPKCGNGYWPCYHCFRLFRVFESNWSIL